MNVKVSDTMCNNITEETGVDEVKSMYDEEGRHKEMPWLTYSTMEYVPENGYVFVEHFKSLDKKLNEKVSQEEYYNGVRYLKIKLMGKMDLNRYTQLKPFGSESSKSRRLCRVLESDIVDLDLTQKEKEKGYRYVKVNVPNGRMDKGWLTYSELDDGWRVSTSKQTKRISALRRKKLRKRQRQSKMMEEVKKYISVE